MRFLSVGVLLLCASAGWSQSATDLADGKVTFRGNCGFCHGLDARGGRGPALVGRQFLHGSSDEEIKTVIRSGVPGTTMPAFIMENDELNRLVAFLRSLSGAASAHAAPVTGDVARGQQIYQRNGCAGCHRIGLDGSVFGPELTRVGAGRSPEYIRESIVNPSADIQEEYAGVTVVNREGKRITGIRLNEDTFTVQLRDLSQNFRLFQKDELQQVIPERKSLMPSYATLPKDELQDLLAYLDRMRGDVNAGAAVKKVGGVR
jgi:putative heme-binding domain-containing protein